MKTDKHTRAFTSIRMEELTEVQGGDGFAYDCGRAIRFLVLSGGSCVGTQYAIIDFITNKFLYAE